VLDGFDAPAVTKAVGSARPDAVVHQTTALGGTPALQRVDR
jgi:hypothetical protein